MRRGTTPTHTFTLPDQLANIVKLRITYAQMDEVVLTKTEKETEIDGNTLSVKLTQKDTLSFSCNHAVEIQIKVLTSNGDALVSDIVRVDVDKCLCDEVMT